MIESPGPAHTTMTSIGPILMDKYRTQWGSSSERDPSLQIGVAVVRHHFPVLWRLAGAQTEHRQTRQHHHVDRRHRIKHIVLPSNRYPQRRGVDHRRSIAEERVKARAARIRHHRLGRDSTRSHSGTISISIGLAGVPPRLSYAI